jgi:hypothetical protein
MEWISSSFLKETEHYLLSEHEVGQIHLAIEDDVDC